MDPTKAQAMMDALRRREAFATIGQLTGDPVLGQFGAAEAGRVARRREGLRKTMEAQRKWEEARPSGMPGYVIRAGQIEPVQEYLDWQAGQKEADRQTRLRIAMERAKNPNEWYAREMWKRSMGTPSQMAEARKTLAYLPELQNLAQELQPEGIEIPGWVEAGGDFAREYLPLGSAAAAGIERRGMNPESMRWLERGRQAESDIIRLASGLAVTGFELENVKKWSPWAGNLTKAQRTDRIRNIYNKLGREAVAIGGSAWQDMPMERFLRAGGTPPAPQMTPGQVPPIPETSPGQTIQPGEIPRGSIAPPQRTPETMEQPPAPAPPEMAPGEWEKLSPEEQQWYLQNRGAPL